MQEFTQKTQEQSHSNRVFLTHAATVRPRAITTVFNSPYNATQSQQAQPCCVAVARQTTVSLVRLHISYAAFVGYCESL